MTEAKRRTAPGEGTEVQLSMPRTVTQSGPVDRGKVAKPARPRNRLRDRIGRKGTRNASGSGVQGRAEWSCS